MWYDSKVPCPECGESEAYDILWDPPDSRRLADATIVYSCPHYKEKSESSPCKYCGKKHTPVRQVPASVPVSDCYCDDCVDRCRAEYAPMEALGVGPDGRSCP